MNENVVGGCKRDQFCQVEVCIERDEDCVCRMNDIFIHTNVHYAHSISAVISSYEFLRLYSHEYNSCTSVFAALGKATSCLNFCMFCTLSGNVKCSITLQCN